MKNLSFSLTIMLIVSTMSQAMVVDLSRQLIKSNVRGSLQAKTLTSSAAHFCAGQVRQFFKGNQLQKNIRRSNIISALQSSKYNSSFFNRVHIHQDQGTRFFSSEKQTSYNKNGGFWLKSYLYFGFFGFIIGYNVDLNKYEKKRANQRKAEHFKAKARYFQSEADKFNLKASEWISRESMRMGNLILNQDITAETDFYRMKTEEDSRRVKAYQQAVQIREAIAQKYGEQAEKVERENQEEIESYMTLDFYKSPL